MPIGVGYVPIAFTFGLAAMHTNLSPLLTISISAFIFAGASQFVLISLLSADGSALSIITTVLLMNIRHLFYGPPVMEKLKPSPTAFPLPALSFGLTDEVFATAIGKLERLPETDREHWLAGLQAGAYLSWTTGTAMGIFLGEAAVLQFDVISHMLSFVLQALFFTLLLELVGNVRIRVLAGSILTTLLLLPFTSSHVAMLAGMLMGAFTNMGKDE